MTLTEEPTLSTGTGKQVLPLPSLVATVAAGLGFAAWMPDSRGPGIFLLLVSLLAGAAGMLASDARPPAPSVVLAGAGLVLVAMASVLDALWLVVPNLLFALVLAAHAVANPSNWTEALAAALAPAGRLLNVPGTLVRSASAAAGSANPARAAHLIRGLVIAGALVTVFWALFASADRAFAQLTENLIPDWDLGLLPERLFLFGLAVAVTTAFALVRTAGVSGWLNGPIARISAVPLKFGRVEWITVLGLLNVLFLAFAIVQVVVLLQGHDHILQTAGLTYAEYAREGFIQLLLAAALTLGVVVVTWTRSASKSSSDVLLLKVLLGLLCLLTLGIVGSALRRLGLYEEAFGFTRSRLLAHAVALWLGALLMAVVAAGAMGRTRRLFAMTVGLTTAAVIGFNLINPEAAIVRRNWQRYEDTGKIDTFYLSRLSADAVPVVEGLPDNPIRDQLLEGFRKRVPQSEPWSSANLSRIRAREIIARNSSR